MLDYTSLRSKVVLAPELSDLEKHRFEEVLFAEKSFEKVGVSGQFLWPPQCLIIADCEKVVI